MGASFEEILANYPFLEREDILAACYGVSAIQEISKPGYKPHLAPSKAW
jgi:uncharacterized protein (DUF433 family)